MFYPVIPHAASCRFLVAVPSMAMGTVSLCTVLQDVPLRPTVKHERFQVPLEVHYCAFTCIYGNLVSVPSEWIGECFWSRLPHCGLWVAGFSPELWASTQLLLDTGDFLNGIGLWKPLDSWRFPDQMECSGSDMFRHVQTDTVIRHTKTYTKTYQDIPRPSMTYQGPYLFEGGRSRGWWSFFWSRHRSLAERVSRWVLYRIEHENQPERDGQTWTD